MLIEPRAIIKLHTTGGCASGGDRINISICAAFISSWGKQNSISKRTNNQIYYKKKVGNLNQQPFSTIIL
jgi:hypothetical protein